MRRVVGPAVGAAMLALAACATTGRAGTDLSNLQDSVTAYNDAYRWKNYERAALFLPSETRAAFLGTYEEDDKSLHVEDYQVLRVEMSSEASAKVLVRTRFMQLPSVTLESKKIVQHWHLVNGRWLLEAEDNSIREIDPALLGDDPNSFGGGPEPDPSVEVEVTGPDGETLRKDSVPAGSDPSDDPQR